MSEHDEKKSWRQRLAELSGKAIALIFASVIGPVIAAILIYHFVGSGATTSSPSRSELAPADRHFTVEDILYHGTWALDAPTVTKLQPRTKRPANAREWLPEGTSVTIACAKKGAAYKVKNKGKEEVWLWWAHVTNGSWIAMAAFKQTTIDGSQGFETCS
jgi:hypothetical protein